MSPRLSPLAPIFDVEKKHGAVNVGNTPGTAPFSYEDLTGFIVGWDANTLADQGYADTDTVTSWLDTTGTYDMVTYGTGGGSPYYDEAFSSLNNQPACYFYGAGIFLRYAGLTTSSTLGTVVAVVYPGSTSSFRTVFSSADEGITNGYMRLGINAGKTRSFQRNADTGDAADGSTTLSANTPYVLEWSSSGTAYAQRVNNNNETITMVVGSDTGDWFGDVSNRDADAIGGSISSAGGVSFFNGHIGLVFQTSAQLTAGERTDLYDYLAARFNITMS